MAALFILDIATESADRRATFRLYHDDGRLLDAHEVALDEHRPALWAGLFDTRRHVAHNRGMETAEVQLAALGRFLGWRVLGTAITTRLAEGVAQRTLLVRLPDPTHDQLAAAFARVPWELAIAPGDDRTLLDRNVAVRAAPAGTAPETETAIALEDGEAVRVLLVFAEAQGSNPLAMRLERERLRALFFEKVLPTRNVEVDVLCHGVTRRRLRDQVRARGGYHVVHWSGHGHVDALELALDEGEKAEARVSGEELVGLFSGAGGFIPPVVFLSACHSAAVVRTHDWETLEGTLRKPDENATLRDGDAVEARDGIIGDKMGFTGTALALVQAGVKQVVAMRYEVEHRYARRLARRFYRGLLAEEAHHTVDTALVLARGELKWDKARAGEYDAVDHVNPLVFGAGSVRVEPMARRSAQMDKRAPKPQPLLVNGSRELDPPHGFVGRGAELTRLGARWLGAEGAPVALIQGLAGLGKTALAAEAVNLWFDRFDYVLCFQAKGGALAIEELYRRLDQRLTLASTSYRGRCGENEMARVYLDPTPTLKGAVREEALRNNLIDALTGERILLVLDNFETNLLKHGGPEYACQDPAWDGLFEALGDRLRGSGSRVLVTSRHKPAALANHALWLPLGPLALREAWLFFEGQPSLRGLMTGDWDGKFLARRIMGVTRGHPLILARIADLARAYYDKTDGLTAAGRTAVEAAVDKLHVRGYRELPEVFVGAKASPLTDKQRELERRYLEDVAVVAVDLVIERLSPNGRTLLWVVTRAGEPVAEDMVSGVWGQSASLRLVELCGAGLLVREGEVYAFHELVAERAAAWVEKYPDERGGQTEAEVWTAYGVRYGAVFKALRADAKRDLASEAGRRGIRYLVRARAFEGLGGVTSAMVTGTYDPALLGQVIADLQGVAGEVPPGQVRWRLRANLADALCNSGRPDQALSLYAQAAEEAEAAEHWSDLGSIRQNWANALATVGQLDLARETYRKSADAVRRAGCPPIDFVGRELEAMRMDVEQGRAEQALPVIEAQLAEVRAWWALRQQGKPVPEAPDDEKLARTLASSLNIAYHANLALARWQPCLDLLGENEQVKCAIGGSEHDVARTHFNRYTPLMRLGKRAEAKAVLERCLDVFHRVEDVTNEAKALSALAQVWKALGDPAQTITLTRRALALREHLPDPKDRALSHNNLANCLHVAGLTGEARSHQLAALAYRLTTGLDPRDSLNNLATDIRQSAARGEAFAFAPLADLLATPAFAPLRAFLAERAIPTADLQAAIDALVAQTRAAVAAAPTPQR